MSCDTDVPTFPKLLGTELVLLLTWEEEVDIADVKGARICRAEGWRRREWPGERGTEISKWFPRVCDWNTTRLVKTQLLDEE